MGELHLEHRENIGFHFEDLLAGVGLVADGHELLQARRVDFLVLAGDEQGGYSHELQLVSGDGSLAQVAVDQVHGHEERFRD